MAGELEGWAERSAEQQRLRISDADRHRVTELLREAAGEGRLDMEELDQRIELAYAAKTYGDLVPITADLPVARRGSTQPSLPPAHASRFESSFALMSGQRRAGVWEIAPEHMALALMGGVELDLRQAVFAARETVIRAYAVMGGVDIVVNAHTRVVLDGIGIMGGFDQGRDKVEAQLDRDSPAVRVTGFALMGGVSVQRRAVPGARG